VVLADPAWRCPHHQGRPRTHGNIDALTTAGIHCLANKGYQGTRDTGRVAFRADRTRSPQVGRPSISPMPRSAPSASGPRPPQELAALEHAPLQPQPHHGHRQSRPDAAAEHLNMGSLGVGIGEQVLQGTQLQVRGGWGPRSRGPPAACGPHGSPRRRSSGPRPRCSDHGGWCRGSRWGDLEMSEGLLARCGLRHLNRRPERPHGTP
jgi:hypothetical protein